MRSAADFKKAFKEYMKKPEPERNKTIEARLQKDSETAEAARLAVVAKKEVLKTELAALVKDKPMSPEAKASGRKLEQELVAAFKSGDYGQVEDLLAEMKVLVSDDVGATTGALAALLRARLPADAADKAEHGKGDVLPGPKSTAKDRAAKSDDKSPELAALMGARGDAVAWQQDEIAAVAAAGAELERLNTIWQGLLGDINAKRTLAVQAKGEVAETDRAIASSKANETESDENRKEALQLAIDKPEQKAKWDNAAAGAAQDIVEQQAKQVELGKQKVVDEQKLVEARALLAATVTAAQKSLAAAAERIVKDALAAAQAPKAAPKQGMAVPSSDELLAKLGLNMVPKLDEAALANADVPVDAASLAIDALFPQLQLVANKHGTGRHGTQTGIDKQAARVDSRLSPDQPSDPGGLGGALFEDDAQTTPTELGTERRFEGTQTASSFLSPELEKQAAQLAIKLVTAQCKWSEIEERGTWKPLDNIMVRLPKPASAEGWGVAITRVSGDGKTDGNLVNKTLEDFRRGKISLDDVLKNLNAKMGGTSETDARGEVHLRADFVKEVSIALNRVGGGWINTTQFPAPAKAAELGWSVQGEKVRANAATPEEVCPALAI